MNINHTNVSIGESKVLFGFELDGGAGIGTRAKLSDCGRFRVSRINNKSASNREIEYAGLTIDGSVMVGLTEFVKAGVAERGKANK